MAIRFGPAGNSDIFYEQGYKSSLQMPEWLFNYGLNAYEYPCSRGVNIKEDTARKIGLNAQKFNVQISIHAPYYINLASQEYEKIDNSINYIVESTVAASWMGAKRVVLHPGSCSKMDRGHALSTALNALKRAVTIIDERGLGNIILCPETMGKRNQLGTIDEVIELCKIDERLIPTVDFGHVNSLGAGCLKNKDDYRIVLDKIKNSLGDYRLKNLHCHFSKIEYTEAGEKKHLTLEDTVYGPEFEPLAELLVEYDMHPVIINESRGTMAQDALKLKHIYENFLKSDC